MDAEPNYDQEMKLPDGKRCDDCAHSRRCFAFGFSEPGQDSCDFWPSRFVLRTTRTASADSAPGEEAGK